MIIRTLITFVRNDRLNQRYCWMATILGCVGWIIFKSIYYYPNIVFDSYHYIKAAVRHYNVNAWPIGYSKFLEGFALFSHSHILLVTLQFFMLQTCLLFFFLSWRWLFSPEKKISHIVFIVLFANPLFVFSSNFVLADTLFVSLSIVWITLLLWLVAQPRPYMILIHAILLLLVFSVRYNSLYYPLVAILAFSLCPMNIKFRILGAVSSLLIVSTFFLYTTIQTESISGERQFSAFGGWKLANDALYMYAHVPPQTRTIVPDKFRAIDSMVREYFDNTPDLAARLNDDPSSGSHYMFDLRTPLVVYMNKRYGASWPFLGTKKWFLVAPLLQSYGAWLIKTYPMEFARYFIGPNCIQYLMPTKEIIGSPVPFVLHESFGGEYLRAFLRLQNIQTPEWAVDLDGNIFTYFPIMATLMHCIFIAGLLGFVQTKGSKRVSSIQKSAIRIIIFLWICDAGFSIISAGIVLRYQMFIMVLELSIGSVMLALTYKELGVKQNGIAPSRI